MYRFNGTIGDQYVFYGNGQEITLLYEPFIWVDKINDEIKKCVEFKQHNLLKDEYPSSCDLIVCRNVMIYFTEEAKKDIYINFNKALKKEGILFVGSTEQIIQPKQLGYTSAKSFFYEKI